MRNRDLAYLHHYGQGSNGALVSGILGTQTDNTELAVVSGIALVAGILIGSKITFHSPVRKRNR